MEIATKLIEFLFLVIAIVFFSFLIVFLTGRFLDITVEKSNIQDYSKAMNMLHVLGNSGELTVVDTDGDPVKIVFDSTKLDSLNNRGEELSCCNYPDFDYWAEIVDLDGGKKWTIGFPEQYINDNFFKGRYCKVIDADKALLRYSIPATVRTATAFCGGKPTECSKLDSKKCENQDGCFLPPGTDKCVNSPGAKSCHEIVEKSKCGNSDEPQYGCSWVEVDAYVNPAKITMKLIKTPLSNIAFNVLRACKNPEHEMSFPVYNINGIEVRDGDVDTICVTLNSAKYGIARACKEIICESKIVGGGKFDEQKCNRDCSQCMVTIKRVGNEVKIIV